MHGNRAARIRGGADRAWPGPSPPRSTTARSLPGDARSPLHASGTVRSDRECARKRTAGSCLVSDLIAEISLTAAIAHDVARRVEIDLVAGEHVGDRRNAVEFDHRDGEMPAAIG